MAGLEDGYGDFYGTEMRKRRKNWREKSVSLAMFRTLLPIFSFLQYNIVIYRYPFSQQ